MSQQYIYADDFEQHRPPLRDNKRMYVRANVSLPCGEVDPNTLRPINTYHPNRVQAMMLDKAEREKQLEKEKSRKGVYISLRTAILAVAVTLFILGVMSLSQYGRLTEQQKQLNQMNGSIEKCVQANNKIRDDITSASDKMKICYTAAQELDMVPADSANDNTYVIVAVSARPQSSDQATQELQAVAMAAQMAGAGLTGSAQ